MSSITTGLLTLAAVGTAVVVPMFIAAAIIEHRNTRQQWMDTYQEPPDPPTGPPVPEAWQAAAALPPDTWALNDTTPIPAVRGPVKRYVQGGGKLARALALRDGALAWAWTDVGPPARPAAGPWGAWA